MAIYHFSAKVISRAAGSSAVASAAYRSASRLHDERLDRHHDFSNKAGVVHSEVMLPDGAPEHLSDREKLWNEVEAAEKRIDAQLAREIEFAIPREMTQEQGIELARDFVKREFVDRGMIADLNVHRDVGADGMAKPHAHVMLTMREVDEGGFGKKNRDWNRTDLLEKWRERWSEHVNQRLAELDIDARIDHRSLEAQGIGLEPQHKIGPAASRMAAQGLQFARSVGEPFTADQQQELSSSRAGLNAVRPHAALDLETALANAPSLTREAADGRTAATVRAMQLEAELRADPQLRADTFVQRWQALDRQRRMLLRDQEDTRANAVGDRMLGMAKSLGRDPQVESLLRNRKTQLGLPEMPGRSVGQSLADVIGRGRSRGLGIGM